LTPYLPTFSYNHSLVSHMTVSFTAFTSLLSSTTDNDGCNGSICICKSKYFSQLWFILLSNVRDNNSRSQFILASTYWYAEAMWEMELEGFCTTMTIKTNSLNWFPVFLVFNAKKSTRTKQNWFGLNRFLVQSWLY
jgi:hypothetical protein